MADGADPGGIRTPDDLAARFDALRRSQGHRAGKRRLSLQDMVRRVREHCGREVPRSTLDNYLRGRTLAPPDVYEAILRALNIPDQELRAWADAWDRLDEARRPVRDAPTALGVSGVSVGSEGPEKSRDSGAGRWRRALGGRRGALVVVAALVVMTPALVLAYGARESGRSAPQAAPGECVYVPVGAPVRVHPFPSFDTGVRFESINDVRQQVTGACEPLHAVTGTDTCGIGAARIDTWIRVRTPYPGWIFEPCLRLRP
ncbi:helix-turn-helix domain-containing protein [Actinomadura verrucosospora]|uniref:HTH cro/C1-type domain-containing protein n=1 Tax=Actinomadura verrucosospora TaxID=46165 RepID=A0A7D3VV71_ACTVE|nr:helix-turn-helix transcriptional regulator [Actinomadura verrucosospora]QKG23598.1 hypothetical protein ACTIVE_5241 [Actinomadura verrucosospora]